MFPNQLGQNHRTKHDQLWVLIIPMHLMQHLTNFAGATILQNQPFANSGESFYECPERDATRAGLIARLITMH